MGGIRLEHPVQDRPADDIPRRQLAGRVILLHEPHAVAVHQHGPLAPQRLGDQRPRRPGDIQRRRVKLHELHVPQDRPGAVGHPQPVRRRHFRIGRLAIQPARSAGRQDRARRPENHQSRRRPKSQHPEALVVVVGDQIDREDMLHHMDAGILPYLADQGLGDPAPRRVAVGVGDAGVAVSAFQRDVDLAVDPVELRAPLVKLPDQLRPARDHQLDDAPVAQSAAGLERVGDMVFDPVLAAQHRRDAALCVPGVALVQRPLADQRDIPLSGRFDRGPQARDARSDDQAVRKQLLSRTGVDGN